MSQTQIRISPLGIYYPDWGEWEPAQQTVQLTAGECEREGLFWLNGLCFAIPEAEVIDIQYNIERRSTDNVLMYHYYIVRHS